MEQSLFVELIHRTISTLDTISKLTQLSRVKSGDREFGEFFHKAVTKEIEKHNLLLNTFLKYIESTTPILKRETINKLIEKVLKQHQAQFEEKRTKIVKRYERELPEIIVPDEQLIFILDSLLQYAIPFLPADGTMEFLTRSVVVPGITPGATTEEKEFFKRNGKHVEIGVSFTSYKKPIEQSEKKLEVSSPQEEAFSDLVYKLVDMIVRKNRGTIKFEIDERESKNTISLKFPVERRRVVYYHLTNG
ncbi:MAG TPA: hypothetical protein VLK23_11825 [Thermodesulfobacteriota bacterium]|nr:hypothetical protein [Thermodesulfobacteriota bacterium]